MRLAERLCFYQTVTQSFLVSQKTKTVMLETRGVSCQLAISIGVINRKAQHRLRAKYISASLHDVYWHVLIY